MAQDFNRDVQRIIDTERYNKVFPDTYLNGSNVVTVANNYLRNSTVFETVGHKGSFCVVGVAVRTGKTVDVAILDDVYKDYAEGNSPIVREAAWNGTPRLYVHVCTIEANNLSYLLVGTKRI